MDQNTKEKGMGFFKCEKQCHFRNHPFEMASSKRIAVICASNQNRSMETHNLFVERGVPNVSSYGTGSQIKLPGPSRNQPNVYDFGATYQEIYQDLIAKDQQFYESRGLLGMLSRNMKVKTRPQRFQDEFNAQFELIFTFELRVFDLVVEDLRNRESTTHRLVHVINFETTDTQQDAAEGAKEVYELLQIMNNKGDSWSDEVDLCIVEYLASLASRKLPERSILHEVLYY
jgi:RNA polymerase II subunit A C-terminal domain phosphatase SSU72